MYELLDEILDFGYPQNAALDVLKLYINLGSQKAPTSASEDRRMTSTITGARDWRREGIVHKKNEIFIDVLESVNLLLSQNGTVLRNDVTGQVQMKTMLSGMPECKLGLNDKLQIDRDVGGGGKGGAAAAGAKKKAGVELDDVQFHRCVQLGKFDTDRTITFVPPDGEFELMRYRITENVNLPFRIIPVIEEQVRRSTGTGLRNRADHGDVAAICSPCLPSSASPPLTPDRRARHGSRSTSRPSRTSPINCLRRMYRSRFL